VLKIDFRAGPDELAKVLYHYGIGDGVDKIVCPFHDDVNPSMKLNFNDGTFYCFGCGASGDAARFVMLAEKCDELASVFKLFEILKTDEVSTIHAKKVKAKTRKQKELDTVISRDYYKCLATVDWKSCSDEDVCKAKKYMLKRGFTAKTLNESGAKYSYNNSYPLIFPVLDNGKFRGYVCRTTDKKVEAKRKYLYNKGFSRATMLCGTYTQKTVVVVEGYMDRLKFNQFGLKQVVALFGWKATDEQIAKLKQAGIKTIISALDTDECGRKGTRYLAKHFDVIPFQFPAGVKDPGDMTIEQFKKSYKITKRSLIK
jgi:DNA primase